MLNKSIEKPRSVPQGTTDLLFVRCATSSSPLGAAIENTKGKGFVSKNLLKKSPEK